MWLSCVEKERVFVCIKYPSPELFNKCRCKKMYKNYLGQNRWQILYSVRIHFCAPNQSPKRRLHNTSLGIFHINFRLNIIYHTRIHTGGLGSIHIFHPGPFIPYSVCGSFYPIFRVRVQFFSAMSAPRLLGSRLFV